MASLCKRLKNLKYLSVLFISIKNDETAVCPLIAIKKLFKLFLFWVDTLLHNHKVTTMFADLADPYISLAVDATYFYVSYLFTDRKLSVFRGK